jgi:anti-sigma factor RsiW
MSLSVQHLSDEAVAAFADGVLAAGPRGRAERHLAECPECAYSVAEQRAAVWALRAAPAPALPSGLLDRLRELPTTTELPPDPLVLGPDGSAAFAAFGVRAGVDRHHHSRLASFVPLSHAARRRTQQAALATAAVALVSLGAVGSTAGNAITQPTTAHPGSRVSTNQPQLVNYTPARAH